MQRPSLQKLCGLLATTAIALVLIGCNGKAGQNGVNGTPGAPGNTYVNTVNASQLTQAELAALSLQGSVTSAAVNGKTTVNFTIKNDLGTPVSGLTAANMGFSIAKLIPQSGSAPSRWVNYSVASGLAAGKVAGVAFPEPENTGTLKDNGDGTYVYTSALDITQAMAMANAAAYDANHLQSDLDDLSYVATDVHRVILSVGAAYSNSALVGAQVLSSANLSYDFIPSTGKAAAATDPSRVIADLSGCNSCHSTLSMHATRFPGVQDPKLCVVCHTDQLKYGSGDSVPTDGTTNLVINGAYGSTQKLMGRALADFPNMIHHIHAGEDLYFQGYNQFGVMYNKVAYPQQKNCSKCHSAAATPQGANWNMVPSRKACGGCHDNVDWTNGVILGTGAGHSVQLTDANCSATGCHTAAAIQVYHTFNDVTALNPTTPAGIGNFTFNIGAVTLDTNRNLNVTFQIFKDGVAITSLSPVATVNNVVSGAVVVDPDARPLTAFPQYIGGPSFLINYTEPQDGIVAPADYNIELSVSLPALLVASGSPNAGSLTSLTADSNNNFTAVLTGDLVGQPAAYSGWVSPAVPAAAFSPIKKTPLALPADASLITVSMRGTFTQVDFSAADPSIAAQYAYTKSDPTKFDNTGLYGSSTPAKPVIIPQTGGLYRVGPMVRKALNTARRQVIDNNKCNACHDSLGTNPSFHGASISVLTLGGGALGAGPSTDGDQCNACHLPNRANSGGWAAGSSAFIHGIHGASERTVPYGFHATGNIGTVGHYDYSMLLYPGVLNQCEQCHLPGTYDFSAPTSAAALPNLLWTTPAAGNLTYTTVNNVAPYIKPTAVPTPSASAPTSWVGTYGAAYSGTSTTGTAPNQTTALIPTAAGATSLVTSPITAACSACHDSAAAISHFKSTGGTFYEYRNTTPLVYPIPATAKTEACLTCHGSGAAYDIKVVHGIQ